MRSRPDLSTGRRPSLAAPVRWGGLFSLYRGSISLRQPTGLAILPGGTPANLRSRRNTAAIVSRSATAGPQTTWRASLRALRAADCQGRPSVMGPSTEKTPRSASMTIRRTAAWVRVRPWSKKRVHHTTACMPSSLWAALSLSNEYVASHDFRHAFHELQHVVPHPACRDLV